MRMMVEIQGPAGRYQLGEIIHGETKDSEKTPGEEVQERAVEGRENGELPALLGGEGVELKVESEMKEIGLHVLICSVAWETLDGRRTFQRFLKFNVGALFPLGNTHFD